MALASFGGESGGFAASDEVFLLLSAVVNAVEEGADAEDEEVNAEEAGEEAFGV